MNVLWQIHNLARQLAVSEAQLLRLAREIAMDEDLVCIERTTRDERREIWNVLLQIQDARLRMAA